MRETFGWHLDSYFARYHVEKLVELLECQVPMRLLAAGEAHLNTHFISRFHKLFCLFRA